MWETRETASEIARAIERRYPNDSFILVGRTWPKLVERLGSRLCGVVEFPFEVDSTPQIPGLILINDALADLPDIWAFLRSLRRRLPESSRCILVHSSWYWQAISDFFRRLLKKGETRPRSWLSQIDISNLLSLNGFEIVHQENRILLPWRIPMITKFCNRFLIHFPPFRWLNLCRFYYVRPIPGWIDGGGRTTLPSVSIIVPARNEKGNIERCVAETPIFGSRTELIFVEGGSKDGTAEEIDRVSKAYRGPLEIKMLRQPKADGKGGAVRSGFDAATGDILMILDGDLTVPPKELPKFLYAILEGRGDLIMGSRLVYPMEKEAMRTLNILGNRTFSAIFTVLLGRPIKDTLCGTKVLRKSDYERIKANRVVFGDFDPFGDFDLIFGAALQNFKIVEIPIRYYARSYGSTNIHRFTHGWLLFKMCGYAFRFFKLH